VGSWGQAPGLHQQVVIISYAHKKKTATSPSKLQNLHPQYLYRARREHPFIMALAPFALFVVSDTITVDVRFQGPFSYLLWSRCSTDSLQTHLQHLNRVLADESSDGNHLLAPVVEPDLSSPYSATPRRPYDSTGKKMPAAEHPPPVPADILTPARNPFVGATLESCAAYLRASASVDPPWHTESFAVLGEQYVTHGTILVAHSYVAGEDKYAPEFIKCFHDGVQAYPCEKGTVLGHLTLRTGQDFQEDLERYQRICKSSGVEDRSVGIAWELFTERKEENTPSV